LGDNKFVIDGEIEGGPEPAYSLEPLPPKSESAKTILLSLIAISILLLVVAIYMFIQYNKSTTKLAEMMGKIATVETLSKENISLKAINDTLQNRVQVLQEENNILAENMDSATGIFFEVQIGNFTHFDLDAYVNELDALRQEKSGKNTKLILGRFRSFNKATLFEKDMKKMGFTSAFIIGRINGKLVSYQEALAACQKEQAK
jgi:hypothetical protein